MVYVYIWKLLLPCISLPRFWHILFHSLGPFRAWNKRLSPSRRKADETCCVNVCLGVFSSISSQALRGLLQFLTSKESHLPKLLPTAVNSLHFFLLFLQETEKLAWLLFNFAKSPFAAQNYIEKILSWESWTFLRCKLKWLQKESKKSAAILMVKRSSWFSTITQQSQSELLLVLCFI